MLNYKDFLPVEKSLFFSFLIHIYKIYISRISSPLLNPYIFLNYFLKTASGKKNKMLFKEKKTDSLQKEKEKKEQK